MKIEKTAQKTRDEEQSKSEFWPINNHYDQYTNPRQPRYSSCRPFEKSVYLPAHVWSGDITDGARGEVSNIKCRV